VRFQVLTAVSVKITVFWDVIPRKLYTFTNIPGETAASINRVDDEDGKFLCKSGTILSARPSDVTVLISVLIHPF
jgi:hypothetical protein